MEVRPGRAASALPTLFPICEDSRSSFAIASSLSRWRLPPLAWRGDRIKRMHARRQVTPHFVPVVSSPAKIRVTQSSRDFFFLHGTSFTDGTGLLRAPLSRDMTSGNEIEPAGVRPAPQLTRRENEIGQVPGDGRYRRHVLGFRLSR